MTDVHFTPASAHGWIAFVADERVLVVDASPDDSFVEAIWAVVDRDDALQRLLDLLTSRGLSSTPPFALLDWSAGEGTATGAVRAIVRGEVTVAVAGASGSETINGAGVSTWIERAIDSVSGAVITVDAAIAAITVALPIRSGAAWVAALAIEITPGVPVPVTEQAATEQPATEHPATEEAVAAPSVSEVTVSDVTVSDVTVTDLAITDLSSGNQSVVDPTAEPPIDDLEKSPEGYDYLFGDTMYRSVADAAVRHEVEDESASATSNEPSAIPSADAAPVDAGDHDGHTVLTSDIAKLRGRRRPKTQAAQDQPAASSVTLVLSTGAREPLTQPILVGRSPSVSQVSGEKMPRLITVGGADQDISRTHARFALEGDTVVVTDLHSRNGTTVAMPGKEAQKLRAGEPTAVIVGTVVDLGGGITVTVDED